MTCAQSARVRVSVTATSRHPTGRSNAGRDDPRVTGAGDGEGLGGPGSADRGDHARPARVVTGPGRGVVPTLARPPGGTEGRPGPPVRRPVRLAGVGKPPHVAERDQPAVAAARAERAVASAGLDPGRLVFLNEPFGTTKMTRLYGWGPTSERVPGVVPFGHWTTATFLAAFRLDGLFAALVLGGPVTGDRFEEYVRRALLPA